MSKRRSRDGATPEITPLIDVVFLLLIFFMVSTVFKKDELALLLTLPSSESGEATAKQAENYVIELSSSGIAFNGKETNLEELPALLNGIQKKDSLVDFRIDREVKYDNVVRVLDLLKKNKLNNISLITETSKD